MRRQSLVAAALVMVASPALTGCIARAAIDIATAPVRVASKAVDVATTSQSEADEKRGRALRKREERLDQLERNHARQIGLCGAGSEEARLIRAEIEEILPTRPVEP